MVGVVAGLDRLRDNSFLTHLATGRLILDQGFPTTDPYTFTAPGAPWVPTSWLASVLYGVTDELVGLQGIRVLVAVGTGGLLVLAWRSTAVARTIAGRAVAMAPFLVMALPGFSPRPLLFGLLCLQVTILVAEDAAPPWLLLPTGWVWLNTHGSWIVGVAALVLLGVGRWLDERRVGPEWRTLTWLGAGLALGVLNPYWFDQLVFPLRLFAHREVTRSIVEWQPPTFDDVDQYGFLLLVVVAIAALTRRPSWRAAVPLAVLLVGSLLAVRNMSATAIVVLPTVAAGLRDLGSGARWVPRQALAGPVAVVAVAATLFGLVRLRDPALDLRLYPVEATACLEDQGLGPRDVRVAAPDFVGNYFALRYGAAGVVFVDDRADLTTVELARDHRALLRGRAGWDEALDRWDIQAVLWPREFVLAELLANEPGWRRTCTDERYVAYVRE